MDTFPKIHSLYKELYGEIATLKNELKKDVNYSVQHAEIIDFIDTAEEILKESDTQLQNIERDIDMLNENLENRNLRDDDEDEREVRMVTGDDDDDDDE
jgi:hypothetical protein